MTKFISDNTESLDEYIKLTKKYNLLKKITSNDLDPLQLTEGKGGKAGDKARLRELLVPETMTPSQFKTTWENATADKVIQYKI